MQRHWLSFSACCGCALLGPQGMAAEDVEFFEARIRPVLVTQCYECHSAAADEVKGGLLLDFRDGIRKGGESGPAVVPGSPEKSLLLKALRYEAVEMPPGGPLPAAVIADFDRWIRRGAADPREQAPSPTEAAEMAWKGKLAERSRWWSLQPPRETTPPPAIDATWAREPVDRFIRDRLLQAGLSPAEPADSLTLLRRLSFVLTGLPPTPDQVQAFPLAHAADPDAAVNALVSALLASPHFGEHFARHWMDVVRYTDTYGYEWDNPAKGSWEFRDYLIRAFNDDIPFDQLIREQLAGDLLPQHRINIALGIDESLIGPMFFHMGEHRHGTSIEFNGIHQEMVNNKIDAFSKAFLALTVACARCHDHKLDAISQADYYALAGIFMSPRWTARLIDAPDKYAVEIAELKTLRGEIRRGLGELWKSTFVAKGPEEFKKWVQANVSALQSSGIDDIAYPLTRLLAASADAVPATWSELAAQWQAEQSRRAQAGGRKYEILSDFSQPGFPPGWITEGDGLAQGYVRDGEPLVALDGDRLIASLLPRGYHTHALSSKLPGAVRLPPQDQIPGRQVSLKLQGGQWSGFLVVPQNAFQTESVSFLDPTAGAAWTTIADSPLKNGVTRVLTEVATAALNPDFPPRTGKAQAGKTTLPPEDDGLQKRSWFSLTGIVSSDQGQTPVETLALFAPLYEGPPPTTEEQVWERVASWLSGTVERWCANETVAADVQILNWLLAQGLLPNDPQVAPALALLVQHYRECEGRIGFPRSALSMDERCLPPLNYRLNVRGNVDDDGPEIPRDYLEVFSAENQVRMSAGSGRLELAEYLTSPNHALAARVYVNRVWQWIFGTGIVPTSSDFGKLGERPSHPELLDWLAVQFVREGWSTKSLVRRLVLSQTFRQSGTVISEAAERDPENHLLHHYPTRRLQAEAIRDSLLAVSGRLDPALYGPPINPPRSAEDAAKRLFSGPLESRGRRSVYLQMSIMDPPRFLVCFNLPDLKLPTGQRDVTNVPSQALTLLNDPLVVQLAAHWADRMLQDDARIPDDRIKVMFIQALGRPPREHELQRWTQAVVQFSGSDDLLADQAAWAELAHALFNTKEFIYYR